MSTRKPHLGRSSAQVREITRVLTGLNQRLQTLPGGAVAAMAQAAVYHVGGTRWASVTLLRPGQVRTLVATAPVAQEAEALQHELGSGPGVDPVLEGNVCLSADLSQDPRWPEFGVRVNQRLGVASLLTYRVPLVEEPEAMVGLNLYSDAVDAFDGQALWTAGLLAPHGALAVAAQLHHQNLEHLEHGLRTHREIGAAVGVLMTRHGITRQQAFDLLRGISQNTHRTLAEIATEILDTGNLPLPHTLTGTRPRRAPEATP